MGVLKLDFFLVDDIDSYHVIVTFIIDNLWIKAYIKKKIFIMWVRHLLKMVVSKLWLLFVFYQTTAVFGASNYEWTNPVVNSSGAWILQGSSMRFEPYEKGSCYPDKISGGGEFDLVITQNFVCDATAKSPAEFKAGFKWSRPPAKMLPGEAVPITLSADYLGGTPDFGICSIYAYFKDLDHNKAGNGVTGLINGQRHYVFDNMVKKVVYAPFVSTRPNDTQTLIVTIKGSSQWYWEYNYKWSESENDQLPADITIDWGTRGDALKGSPGQQFNVYLPPGGSPSSRLWGTDIYTDDSSIGSAAVHAGLLSFANGGNVIVEKMAGQANYTGSTRHGITSASWGAYGASFILKSGGTIINPDPKAIAANWNTQADNFRGRNGERFTYTFPAGGTISSRVWGTDVYTDDSSIGSCAVHAGLITAASGGTVTIEIRSGQSSYKGTSRNGVMSKDYGAYSGSFVFVGGNAGVIINPDPKAIAADWNTQANNFRGRNGERFTYTFPAGGTISSRVWGTDVYTDDSSIGSCAVHAGLITAASGGTVTIEIRAGQSAYKGTSRNGVMSKDYGAYSGSFVFVGGNAGVIINPDPKAIAADWNTQANNFRGRNGERFTYTFPAGGTISSRVWGTDMYTDDSSIGSCAVHAGLITAAGGGTVTIEIRAGQSSYKGTSRNGVMSKDYGAYSGSFVFVGGNASVITNPDPKAITADWNIQADNLRGRNGERFTYTFPAGGTISSRVWGTDVYTDDSSIGSCAVHAGLITAARGGTVTIEIRAGQSAYKGTTRNGVVSKDWGAYSGSFVFVGY